MLSEKLVVNALPRAAFRGAQLLSVQQDGLKQPIRNLDEGRMTALACIKKGREGKSVFQDYVRRLGRTAAEFMQIISYMHVHTRKFFQAKSATDFSDSEGAAKVPE